MSDVYTIKLSRLDELLAKIGESYKVYTMDIAKTPSDQNAKAFFFPQSEEMYTASADGLSFTPPDAPVDPFVCFGLRACDWAAIEVLDRVFLKDPADTYYAKRRELGTIVTVACHDPAETCFCEIFGIDAAEPKGDAAVWFVGEDLYWKDLTEKGEALTAKLSGFLKSGEKGVDDAKAAIRNKIKNLPLNALDLRPFAPNQLNEIFDSPKWETLSMPCLACGTCTFVCPTCQCYDLRDHETGDGTLKFRCWDSCMFEGFTQMAHGNNRNTQSQRYRQRFMHKLVYFPKENGGVYSCVGCGRCLKLCPSRTNIAKVIKAFGGGAND